MCFSVVHTHEWALTLRSVCSNTKVDLIHKVLRPGILVPAELKIVQSWRIRSSDCLSIAGSHSAFVNIVTNPRRNS